MAKQRFEDPVLVGCDGPLHHVLTQAPSAIDNDDIWKTGLGVDGKHNARSCLIGADHLLHAGGECHLHVVEPLFLTVADGSVSKQRGVALATGLQQLILASHVEKSLLLARETRFGQVFSSGTAPHRHIDLINAIPLTQIVVGTGDLVGDRFREGRIAEETADLLAGLLQRNLAGLEIVQVSTHLLNQIVSFQKCAVGLCRGSKSVRHAYAFLFQRL